ncbi:unnamed protein product [Acanthoscelides obtectus]|uniref:Uncharacterized protein n=1 Tax=Acanthoscelides obtectus TaxID=200917 RepID=A0A9P0Q2H8_ACAOB|nr:unnamed protein product [Acanthoscelides obtectus]CAK1651238.1 hypothetical protein AOBTE_LOCUS17132 [Acanthoscelides obtectus]
MVHPPYEKYILMIPEGWEKVLVSKANAFVNQNTPEKTAHAQHLHQTATYQTLLKCVTATENVIVTNASVIRHTQISSAKSTDPTIQFVRFTSRMLKKLLLVKSTNFKEMVWTYMLM